MMLDTSLRNDNGNLTDVAGRSGLLPKHHAAYTYHLTC